MTSFVGAALMGLSNASASNRAIILAALLFQRSSAISLDTMGSRGWQFGKFRSYQEYFSELCWLWLFGYGYPDVFSR